jgi:hypothetical protein
MIAPKRPQSRGIALFFAIAFGLLSLCVRPASAQTSCPPQGPIQGWPIGSPVYYSLSSSFTSNENAAIAAAFSNWNSTSTPLGIFFAPASDSNPAMITVQPGSAGGRPAKTTPTTNPVGTCANVLLSAMVISDITNAGAPSRTKFFDNTQSSYLTVITKVSQHEIGHTMGLGDEPRTRTR